MAVGLAVSQLPKTGHWNIARPTLINPKNFEPMTSIMSYQYPLPPAPDVDVSPSNTLNIYHLPAITPPMHSQTLQKAPPMRRPSGAPKTGKMKRSASSPNVRGQARADQTESAFISLADEKRRNKLGYHRTSVACGHCRRRKIRCIPAIGDTQNRCANCIRLKKECHFHPVDQQGEAGLAQRRDSQVQGTIGRASSSSSPPNGVTQVSDMQNTLPYPHLSMPPIHDIGGPGKRPRNDSFSPENKGSRGPDYGHPANWMPNDVKPPSEIPPSYWRMNHESPVTPAFSPFPPNGQLPHHSGWPHTATEPSPREDLGWPVPQRSMSYSHHEGLHHSSTYPNFHQPPSEPNGREEYAARSAPQQPDVYAPTLTPTSVSLSTSETPLSATSTEAPPHTSGPSPLPPPYPNSQGWQPYPYKVPAIPSNNEGFQGWYGQNSNPPSHSHGGEGMAPPAYGHVESYSGMYYPTATQGGR